MPTEGARRPEMRGECGVVEGEGEYAMYRPDDMPASCSRCSPSFPRKISSRRVSARALIAAEW
jgi:hypothetical protein